MENKYKTSLESILENKKFGNLSILTPLVILGVGVIITIASFFVGGGSHESGTRSIEILSTTIALATTGSITSYKAKSQTRIDLENYISTISPSSLDTEDGGTVLSLKTDDPSLHGNFNNNFSDIEKEKVVVSGLND